MDYSQILKRAWNILWNYRVLWIFGVILALTGGANFSGTNNGINYRQHSNRSFNFPGSQEFGRQLDRFGSLFSQGITPELRQTLIWVVIAIVVFFLLLAIIFAIGRYVSQVALIQMVDRYENSQEKVNWKEGFRLGWRRAAWRLFLINLVIFVPVFLVIIILFGCAATPVIASRMAGEQTLALGIVATVGLVFLVIFLLIIIGVALGLIIEIINRECVLQEAGVIASIRQGWRIVRRNFKDVFFLWLILLGIRIGYFILMIPVALLLMGLGVLVGGGIGLPIGLLGRAVLTGAAAWTPGAIVGGLVFLLILAVPLLFLGGLKETYFSTSWTLAYRQLSITAPLETPGDLPGLNSHDEDRSIHS